MKIICPICKCECIMRNCAFYDVINRRCPYGAEAQREQLALLKSIETKVSSIKNVGVARW
jgi:hypothetical protein